MSQRLLPLAALEIVSLNSLFPWFPPKRIRMRITGILGGLQVVDNSEDFVLGRLVHTGHAKRVQSQTRGYG